MNHIGIEQVIHVGGVAFRLSRFTRALLRRWHTWARRYLPDPRAGLIDHLDSFGVEVQEAILGKIDAVLSARDDLASDDMRQVWLSEDGQRHVFGLLLEKYHPDLTEDRRDDIFDQAVNRYDLADLIVQATGTTGPDEYGIEKAYLQELGYMPTKAPSLSKPTDWPEIDRQIFQNLHRLPHEIDQCTLTEISIMLGGKEECTFNEAKAYGLAWRKLTQENKVELLKRKISARSS